MAEVRIESRTDDGTYVEAAGVLREQWREYNRREAWSERLAWAVFLALGGWLLIGWAVALGLAVNEYPTAAAWALGAWFVDMLLLLGLIMTVDD